MLLKSHAIGCVSTLFHNHECIWHCREVVFYPPEMLLERRRWRNMLKGEVYTTRLRTIAVDEAHTVKKWYDLYTCVLFYSLRFL